MAAAAPAAAPPPSGPTDLFISYPWGPVDPATGKRLLQERVLAIVALLRAAGFTVWLDLERMASGATGGAGGTPAAMASGIRGASAVVCFVSAEYARSKNCRLEAEYARMRGKPMYYVNVGAQGWTPGGYAETEAEAEAWLEVLIMTDLWFDARDGGRPGAADTQVAELVGALGANAKVSRSGGGRAGMGGAGGEAEVERLRAQFEAAMKRPALPVADARSLGKQLRKACLEKRTKDALRLCNEGVDANFVDVDGKSALMLASYFGLEAVAVRLVEVGAKLDLVDKDGESALMRASEGGHTAIAQLLADNGAKLDLVDEYGWSSLSFTCFKGHTATAQLLVEKGAKLDLVDEDGSSVLILACFYGHTAVAQLLAAHMDAAALNLVDRDMGKTALDYANEGGRDKDKVAELAPAAAAISARGGLTGAELKARAAPPSTAVAAGGGGAAAAQQQPAVPAVEARAKGALLLKACEGKRAEDAMLLIKEGADVDFVDRRGQTPLFMASCFGLDAVAARLVEAGAKLNLVDKDGSQSALMVASRFGHTAIAQLLADRGAKLNLVDKNRWPALFYACRFGHFAVVQLLADKGAKLDSIDEFGQSALIVASSGGYTAIAQLLADMGADLDCVDGYGKTALTWHSQYGDAATAQLLAARMDADALNEIDGGGKTALDHANASHWRNAKAAELAELAAVIRSRGGLTAAELKARK
jgi:ankyrin repeat protein